MDEVLVPKLEYNNPSKDLIAEKAVETTEPCSMDYHTQSTILIRERRWTIVPEFTSRNSIIAMKLLRQCDQEERDADGGRPLGFSSFKITERI